MKIVLGAAALAALLTTGPAMASDAVPMSPDAILGAARADEWRAIAADNLLIFQLDGGARVVMELADDFAPAHVANIRKLARAHWFDGTPINRVQDNYVVQWSGAAAGKPLPPGVPLPPAEYDRSADGLTFRPLGYRDAYAPETGHVAGWPAARDGGRVWLTHCYGMVGAGRDMPPDTGSGAELYAVIGHGPRHLDRNLAMVGRIVQGIEHLSALPRGGAGGYYEPGDYLTIHSARLASELPANERPRLEVLDSDSASFARWIASRATRPEGFFVRPAGAVDICNAQAPVREAGTK